MSHKQVECQTERIELFLRQQLSDDEQANFERHLNDCDDCCRRLEQSAAAADVWASIRESLHEEGLSLDSEDCSGGSKDSATSEAGPPFSVESVLQLLAPTDDDRMLGRLGTYEVMGIIGTGGMGVVLKAFDPALNRYVAIKILSPHLGNSGAARKRFSREAQAAAAVVHDNVIEIHGVADANGLPYLVMPYVRGPSLQKRLDDDGPLSVVEILRIGKQAAAGLAAAHAQGLVHRDVKPANILLADGIARVKLTDFGLARAADDASLTKTGVIAGTPQYMSPEQARGDAIDATSDLFSLGSVMYTMCAGRPPFRAETSYGILRRITDTEPRPIREVNPEIPDWLCEIISKLMAKQTDDRFASAAEVADLLGAWLAHLQQPDVIPPPERGAKPAISAGDGRTRSGFLKYLAGAAFAFFLLLAGVVIVLELNKGTLTIECEADDVPIKIVQGDRIVEKLTVSKAGRSVRVAAGQYVVEIDGELDGITVADGSVRLQRRGREVVKIIEQVADWNKAPGANDRIGLSREKMTIQPAREAVERFLAALLSDKEDDNAGLSKDTREFKEMLASERVDVANMYINATSDRALAVTTEVKLNEPEPDGRMSGYLVLTLEKKYNNWMIEDIDFESKASLQDEVRRFLEEEGIAGTVDSPGSTTGSADTGTLLLDAIREFNQQQQQDPIGKQQPPLSDDEVVAAIRAVRYDRDAVELSDRDFAVFQNIAETGMLPRGWTVDTLREVEFADGGKVDVWSVVLAYKRPRGNIPLNRIPPDFTHTIRLRALKYQPNKNEGAPKSPDGRVSLWQLVSDFNSGWLLSTAEETPESQAHPGIGPSIVVPTEQPVTVNEIVAALQIALHRPQVKKRRADAAFRKELERIIATQTVPKGSTLDSNLGYSRVDFEFDIRGCYLKIPSAEEGVTAWGTPVRQRFIRSTKIPKTRNEEIAWGPPAEDGLQAGVQLTRIQGGGSPGATYSTKFYFRNRTGKTTAAFEHLIDIFDVDARTPAGEKLPVKKRAGTVRTCIPIFPVEVTGDERIEKPGLPILIGSFDQKYFDEGAFLETTDPFTWDLPAAAVNAQVGKSIRIRFQLPHPANLEGPQLLTGEIRLIVGKEATIGSSHAEEKRPAEEKGTAAVDSSAHAKTTNSLEFRLAWAEPAEGLTELVLAGSEQSVYVRNEPIATNVDVVSAKVIDDPHGKPAVEVTFKEEAAQRLGEATARHVGHPLAILVDGKLLSAPKLQERLGRRGIITGNFSRQDAERIAQALIAAEEASEGSLETEAANASSTSRKLPLDWNIADLQHKRDDLARVVAIWDEALRGAEEGVKSGDESLRPLYRENIPVLRQKLAAARAELDEAEERLASAKRRLGEVIAQDAVPLRERWEIRYPANETRFARALDHFGIEMGVIDPKREKHEELLYLSSLAGYPQVRRGKGRDEQRLYFAPQSGSPSRFCQTLAAKGNIDTRGCLVILLYPQDVQETLAELERQHTKDTPIELVTKTVFEVRAKGSDFEFHVVS